MKETSFFYRDAEGAELPGVSYPPPAPRTTFQGHRVEGNIKAIKVENERKVLFR